jgi:hypothetical protein
VIEMTTARHIFTPIANVRCAISCPSLSRQRRVVEAFRAHVPPRTGRFLAEGVRARSACGVINAASERLRDELL